jgi:hypothetical protein
MLQTLLDKKKKKEKEKGDKPHKEKKEKKEKKLDRTTSVNGLSKTSIKDREVCGDYVRQYTKGSFRA